MDPYWEGAVGEGLPVGYALELPAGRLRDVDGRPLLDDGTYDGGVAKAALAAALPPHC